MESVEVESGSFEEPTNERARALLDAAEELLEELGMEALTARAVAERAGVAKGLVFYYFGSTHELFERVLERYYARHKASLAEAFAGEGDHRERLHRVVDEYLDFMEENVTYARIVQHQIASEGPHLPLVRRHLREVLELTREMLRGITPSRGPRSAEHFHVSLSAVVINYFTYGPVLLDDALEDRPLGERRAHVHWVVDSWLDGLERHR
ncbi:MAG: TetR/AcrR family transcriptional regulator [Deltaproteobacteria bacterium]|nr:TetR/AcrR family transcriptional regulator [Deltaproteobacteria bacterium]